MNTETRGILVAVMNRILPSDDGPGAAEAGVGAYAAEALGHRAFQGGVFEWIEGHLQALEAQARETHGQGFTACAPEQQDALIELRGQDQAGAGREFLNLMVGFGLEGFLGDPAHGGNRDQAGWRYIAYEPRDPLAGHSLSDFEVPTLASARNVVVGERT